MISGEISKEKIVYNYYAASISGFFRSLCIFIVMRYRIINDVIPTKISGRTLSFVSNCLFKPCQAN